MICYIIACIVILLLSFYQVSVFSLIPISGDQRMTLPFCILHIIYFIISLIKAWNKYICIIQFVVWLHTDNFHRRVCGICVIMSILKISSKYDCIIRYHMFKLLNYLLIWLTCPTVQMNSDNEFVTSKCIANVCTWDSKTTETLPNSFSAEIKMNFWSYSLKYGHSTVIMIKIMAIVRLTLQKKYF